MPSYIVSARDIIEEGGGRLFGNEPGPSRFLELPDGEPIDPRYAIPKEAWVEQVVEVATSAGASPGHVVVFVHGYNNTQEAVLDRHRRLQVDLPAAGLQGTVVSYDWPSASSAVNYLEDRGDARETARRLGEGIEMILTRKMLGGRIQVHLLGHSTGAYLIRCAFAGASENSPMRTMDRPIGQVAFVGGDVSRRSMRRGDDRTATLYAACETLTNYQNPEDSVLRLSNAKRAGLSPRVGRDGLPRRAPDHAVNVDCGPYFRTLDEDSLTQGVDYFGNFAHSWHIGNPVFTRDFTSAIQGGAEGGATRATLDGRIVLTA
jgi:pimeloyl-ACP methyl ester carboxylesterase